MFPYLQEICDDDQLMSSIQSCMAVFIYESIITDNYYIKEKQQ
jgi:hypothetical protein